MKSCAIRWLGIGLLIVIGVVHLYLAPAEYEEFAALGYLFIANFLAALIAAAGIRQQATWGWVLGFWAAGGAIAGYIVTRTVGMPGMEPEEWLYPIGVLSMLLEVAFLVLFVLARPWQIERPETEPVEGGEYRRLVLPAAVAFVAVFGISGLVWNAVTPDRDAQLAAQLAHATPISDSEFAAKYGVQVLQVAPSMMNSIVDFRLRIVDKAKAEELLSDHAKMPMLVVGNDKTVLVAPRQHRHHLLLRDGGMYYAFYPNPNGVVKAGTSVAVQFGDLRLAPTTAQ